MQLQQSRARAICTWSAKALGKRITTSHAEPQLSFGTLPLLACGALASRRRLLGCHNTSNCASRSLRLVETVEMEAQRSSSIPRHYRRIPAQERFSVADAAQLKLKLQALDDKLHVNADVQTLKSACQSRPFHEEIYVDGSEEFFLVVKGIARADLIPDTYIEAYATLQQGRFPVNHFRVSDFTKGVDPTISEIRKLLGRIDDLCGTKLDSSLRTLEDQGKCDRAAPSVLICHSQTFSLSPATC
jgi:hypothetical protein